ncbi:MAG: hypothetical protein COY42_01035 [Armatimonadetes bacterium CG_4_10_14_0_8_um_filter_66_14]|nr:DUF1080 domain-containing protein [Armatimonadota bacterium]NCO92484.1 DUF1080 domain-containing protein [Armatimonadota bacterium]OIP07900.1 MAG: hypothetical protein AUJ96_06705 [Armatimonadetes bacterium CG2_30_66_41]PIZ50766.1 MAG: hypothetical protein COY42_01035 [Armatimonadetes bacterium CG_4_10_14_0_8_um_filter_66_14]PJB68942.1 MAG: hypothetical protein CO096_13800 [Armatimonadetes bacterium CG_4_9_14_3_um_filter_66_14]
MKRTILPLCIGAFASAAIVFVALAQPESSYQPRIDKDGWEILLDGKDLNAWNVDPDRDGWALNEQGELHPTKGGPTIFTKQRYCDFVLELDAKVAAGKKSNSGLFFRVHNPGDPVNTGMEIQVLDDVSYGVNWDSMNANGALYDLVHPSSSASSPPGEWDHFRLTVNDNLVTVELNGKEIVQADLDQWTTANQNPNGSHNKFPHAIGSLPREGFLGLQNYGGVPVWFRNIRLKPLTDRKPQYTGKEPIADVLRKPDAK